MSVGWVRKGWNFNAVGRQWNLTEPTANGITVVSGYFEGNGVPYFRVIVPQREEEYMALADAMDAAEVLAGKQALEAKQ